MCKKKSYCNRKVDECLEKTIDRINKYTPFKTLCCCCGHGKYHPTIVIKDKRDRRIYELFTRTELGRRKRNRYYKSDKKKHYYIPEVVRLLNEV